jgi:hypothetical protein
MPIGRLVCACGMIERLRVPRHACRRARRRSCLRVRLFLHIRVRVRTRADRRRALSRGTFNAISMRTRVHACVRIRMDVYIHAYIRCVHPRGHPMCTSIRRMYAEIPKSARVYHTASSDSGTRAGVRVRVSARANGAGDARTDTHTCTRARMPIYLRTGTHATCARRPMSVGDHIFCADACACA